MSADWNSYINSKIIVEALDNFKIDRVEVREDFDNTFTFSVINDEGYGIAFCVKKEQVKIRRKWQGLPIYFRSKIYDIKQKFNKESE